MFWMVNILRNQQYCEIEFQADSSQHLGMMGHSFSSPKSPWNSSRDHRIMKNIIKILYKLRLW
jgi:hypothetical protein